MTSKRSEASWPRLMALLSEAASCLAEMVGSAYRRTGLTCVSDHESPLPARPAIGHSMCKRHSSLRHPSLVGKSASSERPRPITSLMKRSRPPGHRKGKIEHEKLKPRGCSRRARSRVTSHRSNKERRLRSIDAPRKASCTFSSHRCGVSWCLTSVCVAAGDGSSHMHAIVCGSKVRRLIAQALPTTVPRFLGWGPK